MKKSPKPALTIAMILTLLITVVSAFVVWAMFALLALSATPQMMPKQWFMVRMSIVVVPSFLGLGIFAYLRRKAGLLFLTPISLTLYMVIIVYLFATLDPYQ